MRLRRSSTARFAPRFAARFRWTAATITLSLLWIPAASAQLTDETQTQPTVPGGQIGKSFEEQVGAGQGDAYTPYSSVYLIQRDPARSIRRGRQIFQRKFTREQGHGPRVSNESVGDIFVQRAFGAGLSDSCAGCHGRPRGSAGFGGDVVTRPDSRDAPHLFGLGLVEQVAEEITEDLRAIRDEAVAEATGTTTRALDSRELRRSDRRTRRRDGKRDRDPDRYRDDWRDGDRDRDPRPVTRRLESKGISYGWITAYPDGSVDLSRVEGVDEDLRVRPFFAEGGTVSMREFIVGAFKAEMGLESTDEVLCAATEPGATDVAVSPAGFVFDPALDTFERPNDCDDEDADEDGVFDEIPTAAVDHFEFYLLNYFKPGIGRQTDRTRRGLQLMNDVGCTDCHRQNLLIESDRRVADVETVHDPVNGLFNRLFATAETRFVARDDGHVNPVDGRTYPLLVPEGRPFLVENIFADFKRHDLGPDFHEREFDDVVTGGASRVTEFLTEPLWGVATTPPYGHDGRSINLEEVILRHGGEAQRSRNAFASLRENDRRKILEFLGTLVLFPPDDTASNLNPGNPGSADPQAPAEHGSINLGALFQLEYEGAE